MRDVAIGLIAIAVGAFFCFRGYFAMRLVIPVWGAFAGLLLGAGIVDAATDGGFLRTAAGWIVGIVLALVFSALAYFYYEVSVLLGMAAIGFALGTTVTVALGVTWSWVIVLVGVLAATFLASVAIVADLPMIVLAVLTAAAGASTVVAGVMLLTNTVSTDELEAGLTERLNDDWWWYLLYVTLAVVGFVAQIRTGARLRSSLRSAWSEDGGRNFRAAE